MIVLGFIASVAVWIWVLRMYDRLEPEPMKEILRVLVLGGLFSVTGVVFTAGIYDSITFGSELMRALYVGLNEEFFKLLTTVVLVWGMKEMDEPIDAMIYSMTVALGFATVENMLYVSKYGSQVLAMRTILPMPGHMADAAIWGYGLSLYFFRHRWDRTAFIPFILPYYLAAAVAHAAYDYPLFTKTGTFYLSVVVMVCLALLTHARLRQVSRMSPHAGARASEEEA